MALQRKLEVCAIAGLFLAGLLSAPQAGAGVFDTVGGVTGGQLGSDAVVDFSFAGSLQMVDRKGKPVLAKPDSTLTGVISLDLVTAGGTAGMRSKKGFFGVPWRMHHVTLSACGAGPTVNTNLYFDWGGSKNIRVFAEFLLTPAVGSAGPTFTVTEVDSDNDGIPGHRMTSGPFAGFTPVFAGTASYSGTRPGYYPNRHVAVPRSTTAPCTPLDPTLGGFF